MKVEPLTCFRDWEEHAHERNLEAKSHMSWCFWLCTDRITPVLAWMESFLVSKGAFRGSDSREKESS